MRYFGIDRCDRCSQPLDKGEWLHGLCQGCRKALVKRPGEEMKPQGQV